MATTYQASVVAQQIAPYSHQLVPMINLEVYKRLVMAEEEARRAAEAHQRKLASQKKWREKNPKYMEEWRKKKTEQVQQTPAVETHKEQVQVLVEINPQEVLTEIRSHQVIMTTPKGASIISAPPNSETYITLLGTPNPTACYLDTRKVYHMLYNPAPDPHMPFNQAATMYTMATINIRGTVLVCKEKGGITMDEFRALSTKLSYDYAQRQLELARQVDESVQTSLLSSTTK